MIQGGWTEGYDTSSKGLGLGWIWSIYNLVMIGTALLILLDVPRPSPYEWFDLRRTVRIDLGNATFWGVTTMISEIGIEIALTQPGFPELTTESLPLTFGNFGTSSLYCRTGHSHRL